MSEKRSYILLSILSVLLIIIGALSLIYLDVFSNGINEQIAFDRSEWKNGDERTRGKMIEDLIDRHLLIGKNREEVTSLLGPPDKQGEELIAYTIDLGQRFWFGSPWYYDLYVHFDSAGTVQTVGYTD